jgi:nicotinamidase/pyrazinamidase
MFSRPVAAKTRKLKAPPRPGDALIIVDVQNDFLAGGTLAVHDGNAVIPVLNRYILLFSERCLPVFATRDWHPPDHISFKARGGIWPPHCVAGTRGAAFAASLKLPADVLIISKADKPDLDVYSDFQGTDLAMKLKMRKVDRLWVGGLATDYCVLYTVLDGLTEGFDVLVLEDAIRAVNVHPDDGNKAIQKMRDQGAFFGRIS